MINATVFAPNFYQLATASQVLGGADSCEIARVGRIQRKRQAVIGFENSNLIFAHVFLPRRTTSNFNRGCVEIQRIAGPFADNFSNKIMNVWSRASKGTLRCWL